MKTCALSVADHRGTSPPSRNHEIGKPAYQVLDSNIQFSDNPLSGDDYGVPPLVFTKTSVTTISRRMLTKILRRTFLVLEK